jgi:hypothetical protein
MIIYQQKVIKNHENVDVRNIGQDEAQHRNYTRLKLEVVRRITVLEMNFRGSVNLLYRAWTERRLVYTLHIVHYVH